MKATYLHITGIVQGIGFRPYIFRLAQQMKLTGWVNNSTDGVHIHLEGSKSKISSLIHELTRNPPEQAVITGFCQYEVPCNNYGSFEIIASEDQIQKSVLITPDYAICANCEKELFDPDNRRFRYPFITCTLCGPRYSIISALPYDRPNTVMRSFSMCANCQHEFDEVTDRRYYSQTNSCNECGFTLQYHDRSGIRNHYNQKEVLQEVRKSLTQGKIIAVKGIGGYLLLCDATSDEVIRKLRDRKNRPTKPFALLYPGFKQLSEDVYISADQKSLYESIQAPIVLFQLKSHPVSGIKSLQIAPGMNTIGVMRPCAPLLSLISSDFNKPLVATSGNLSGSPIIFNNDEALSSLSSVADVIVTHDRDILMPEDDSVMKVSQDSKRKIIIRRSRGFAPNYFGPENISNQPVLALGASLKSTFCIQHGNNTYVSQYLGDQGSYDAQQSYKQTLKHMSEVLNFQPKVILTDKHPAYSTTLLGKELADHQNLKHYSIQHHEAHFAAVLAENELLDTEEPVLGVIWDGTGYGNDQQVWGGEFMRYQNYRFDRINHFGYYPHVLGDKMPREPRLSALSILKASHSLYALKDKFTQQEWEYYTKLLDRKQPIQTSSAGRLFDAVACVLGLADIINYEGEAAMLLEELAAKGKPEFSIPYKVDWLSPQHQLEVVIEQLNKGVERSQVAWNFHYHMVLSIKEMAEKTGLNRMAFSGGVFQNGVLVDIIEEVLGTKYHLYFHQSLSPNDQNISLGQLMHYEIFRRNSAQLDMHHTTYQDMEHSEHEALTNT